jgi:hypothetical protein
MKMDNENNSYFKTILLGLIDDIIKKYDGKIIKDKYGTNKFKNGKWLVKESGQWTNMIWKHMEVDDLASEIETLTNGIIDSDNVLIIGTSINNTGII